MVKKVPWKYWYYCIVYCRDDELKDDEASFQESIEQKDDATVGQPPVTGKKGKKAKKTFADIDW